MKIITFFNNKGGVGKTTLVYHVASMFAELGHKTLVADLDPQANLTNMYLSNDKLAEIFLSNKKEKTIKWALRKIERSQGDIEKAHTEHINENLFLIPGDLELSLLEDKLSENWYKLLKGEWYPFALQTALYRVLKNTARQHNASYIFVDIGPNFGSLNRAILINSDFFIVPSGADLFSIQGLKNIGNRLQAWQTDWQDALSRRLPESKEIELSENPTIPLGYVIMQHGVSGNKPVKAYQAFAERIPNVFHQYLLSNEGSTYGYDKDPYCLALIKHYHSLMPMAMEARKPIFMLKPADGAIGAHFNAVKKVYDDFENLSKKIIDKMNQYSN